MAKIFGRLATIALLLSVVMISGAASAPVEKERRDPEAKPFGWCYNQYYCNDPM
ncbi:hypothetical protein DFJ73DRAFT_788548 [Zopfochytrium polystomum]|nr:hypothetical protein DFJ73DRAFT_788548 [Zopfochytrium polystomum]